jgi:hypothetical protein
MTDYYVDSDVAGPGSGTFGDPWDDIETNINSLSAGDSMILRGNVGSYQLYTESEIIITVNGTEANPITIRPYQSEKVEIRKSTYGEIFDVDGDWIVIDGIATDQSQLYINKNDSAGYALRVDGDNVTLQNFEIANISGAGSDALIYGGSNSSGGTVDNCKIHDAFKSNTTDAHGVALNGGLNWTVSNCTIYDCAGDCVYIHDGAAAGYGWTISDNTIYTTLSNGSENGIDAKWNTSSGRATINGNTFYGFYSCTGTIGGSGDGDGEAISIHNSCDYVDVYDNTIYDCTSGITVEDGATSIVVRNNLIYDLHTTAQDTNASTSNMGAFHVVGGGSTISIVNNTVHNAPQHYLILITSLTDLTLKNNIFNDCGTLHDPSTLVGSVTADYNCWYNNGDTISGGNDVTDEPLFNNEAGDDYTLASNSPCIDAGVDLGYSYNGDAPDIGYWESDFPAVGVTVAGYAVLKETATVTVGGMAYLQGDQTGAIIVLGGARVVVDGARVVIG